MQQKAGEEPGNEATPALKGPNFHCESVWVGFPNFNEICCPC